MLIFLINFLVSVCTGFLVSLYVYTVLRKSGKLTFMPSKVSKTIYIICGIITCLFCYFLLDTIILIGSFIKYGFVW